MYYERSIAPVIQKINETFPVLIVTGPRQVGKTTLLTHLAGRERKSYLWIIPQSVRLRRVIRNCSYNDMHRRS